MSHFSVAQISAAGMAAQRARIEAAALNLANMSTSAPPGAVGFQPVTAIIRLTSTPFTHVLRGGGLPALLPQATFAPQGGAATRSAYDPGHPDADANGMVSYPAVDHTQEMMTVMTALRAYEANLAVLQTSRMLATKALEIGG
jgi:flagellar basal-body rod protein FlgC